MRNGFITLHRKIMEWEWYQNPNTFRLFVHCLLMANFTDGRLNGKEIKRGQFVTSLPKLAKQTSLTIKQVRVALAHLVRTGEVADDATTQNRIITVINYDRYQTWADDTADEGQTKRQTNFRKTAGETADKRADDEQAKTVVAVSVNENIFAKRADETADETADTNSEKGQTKGHQYNNNNNNYKVVVEEGFAPTDAEIAKSIERDSLIVDAARDVGLQVSTRAMINARDLADKYGLDKLLDAIGASVDVPKWSYVEGILRKGGAKHEGHTDDHGQHENPYAFLHNNKNTI